MKYFYSLFLALMLLSTTKVKAQTYNSFYGDIVNNVSYTNILNDLTTFENFGIKDIGSTALNNAQAWIKGRYESLGYTDIVEQPFSYSGGTTNNIIITKTGTVYPNTYLIIDAHYDTINGPGTNDNGSGTVLLMELARLLKDVDTEYSIKFIHFSGEEDGLIGSNYYVTNTVNPENLDISLVFNIDEVGGINGMANDTIVCEEDTSNPPHNNAASSAATATLATCIGLYSSLNTEISYAYASDYIPFENNGEIITGLYEKNETPHAHTSTDLLINMDVNYLTEVTKGSLGAALHFAIGVDTLSTPEVTINGFSIFPNPSKGQITIKQTHHTTTQLKLVDVLGKEVYKASINNLETTLNLTHLNKGIYMVILKNERQSVSKKLVIH
ncbi:M28 family peptidase [Pontimicrobium sp. IMCC45349]|uniref:M28 family peptidase n=1 Tax=Pontimicrobium sp. IMCC45349 TaxID=3391574 RepID=UPI0039A08713